IRDDLVTGVQTCALPICASHEVGNQIYSGLITFDKDLNPVGDLAESWEFSRDCRDLTFRLRPGVKWHDGRPFTADDVVFTWQTKIGRASCREKGEGRVGR